MRDLILMRMRIGLVLAVMAAAAFPAAAQDRVIFKNRGPAEGKIIKDTWKEVGLSGGQSFKAGEVLRVEYGNAPAPFQAAMRAIEEEKWAEALSSLESADAMVKGTGVEDKSKEKAPPKPPPWFDSYVTFHRGLCQLRLDRREEAIKQFDRILKEFKESRFYPDAFELSLQAHRAKGDDAAMTALEKEIDTAPADLRPDLKLRASRQRVELLYDKNRYADAKKIFEELAVHADADVRAEGTAGVLRCLAALKDAAAVETYANRVLSTASNHSLLLVASNAIGDVYFDRKDYVKARERYVASVVKYCLGRTGPGAEREHERALLQLARCYEELMGAAKEPKLRAAFQEMASSAYRELSVEYPSGSHRDEAAAKAAKYEPKEENK